MLDKTSSIICAFGLASAAPRSPYRHLELCGIALGVRREEFGVGRKQLEISNEELGIGDGVGFIMDFICGVVERYAGDFYIAVFMCYAGHLLASHP